MPMYFCTPRGDVYKAPEFGMSLRYTEKFHDGYCWVYSHHTKGWGTLPMREAPNIDIARVDFFADQTLKDLLTDIKRMFRDCRYDKWALAYRAKYKSWTLNASERRELCAAQTKTP